MKGKKRIGILALSLAFVGVATSCGSYAITRNTTPAKEEDAVVVEDTDRTELKSIVLDTSNVRKTFYIGEEFNYDGLVVNRSLAVYSESGTNKGLVNMPTKDFTVDYSEVDMTTVGTYKVTVTHRLSNRILTQSYNVSVKPSVFESTPGLTFNAGLDVSFEDGKKIKEYLLHDTYVEKYKDDYDHDFNLYSLLNGLSIKLHKWTSTGDTATETRVVSLTPDQVTIDSSSVDIDSVGTYVIKVTYEADDIVIDGVNYSNDASAFLIIEVEDPVQSIWVEGSKTEFEQTLGDLDFSEAGWVVHVETAVEGEHEEPLTYDKYSVSSPDMLDTTSTQKVTISLNENPDIQYKKNVKIIKSETQDLKSYYSLTPSIDEIDGDSKPTVITIGESDYIYGPLPKEFKSVPSYNDASYYTSGATYTGGRSDSFGSLAFPIRISIKGSAQAFKIVMDKPGDIVVFFAPTGDVESDLGMYTLNDKGAYEQVMACTSLGQKQKIINGIYHVEEAGTYYFYAPSDGVYVHGFLIAKNK